jgi:Uma2 family endonuclease
MVVLKAPRPAAVPARKLPLLHPPAPPLEAGDHLSVAEFMRRYEASPNIRKAQLIEGIVHMPSPVNASFHAEPDSLIQGWLFTYSLAHPELKVFPNASLYLDGENVVQPDAILCSPKKGGRVWLDEVGYLHGAPELVVEVSSTTTSIDLHTKLRAYQRNGVGEYLVWLVKDKRVLWYELVEGEYVVKKEQAGKLTSRLFPGLVLDVKALLKLDKAKVVRALA